MSNERITLRVLADRLQLSATTISLALRNQVVISPETRARVQAEAARLGYVTNPCAVAMIHDQRKKKKRLHDRGRVIALLTQFGRTIYPLGEDQWYERLLSGIQARAERAHFKVEEFPIPTLSVASNLNRILRTRGINAVIYFPGYRHFTPPALEWRFFTLVELQESWAGAVLNCVEPDYSAHIDMAFNQLKQLGYRKIGLALTEDLDPGEHYGYSSRFLVHQHFQKPRDRVPIIPMGERLSWQPAFEKWVTKHRPEIILSHESHIPDWLRLMGKRVPEDVGYVNLNWKGDVTNAGVDQRGEHLGELAVDTLLDDLASARFDLPTTPKRISIEGVWRDGPSVMDRRK